MNLCADGTVVVDPLDVPDAHTDAAVRNGFAEVIIGCVVERVRSSLVRRDGMEEIVRADTAAVLTVARTHQCAPSVLGPDLVNALAGGSGILATGGTGQSLHDAGVIAVFILSVDNGGLAAGIDDNIIGRFIVGVFYVLDILGFVLRHLHRGLGGCLGGSGGCGRGGRGGRSRSAGRCGAF